MLYRSVMSEMLANQYFMARDFEKANMLMEDLLDPVNPKPYQLKKLILCNVYLGKIDAALNYFNKLIRINIRFLTDTKIEEEDCPCKEIIAYVQSGHLDRLPESEKYKALGMLFLYCDVIKSVFYFNKSNQTGSDTEITEIVQFIENSITLKSKIVYSEIES